MNNIRYIIKEVVDEFFDDFLKSNNNIEADTFIKELWGYKFEHIEEQDDIVYSINEYPDYKSSVLVSWFFKGIEKSTDYTNEAVMENILKGYWLVKDPKTGKTIDFSDFK